MSIFRKKKKPVEDEFEYEWTEADRALAMSRLEKSKAMAEWPRVEKAATVLSEQLEKNNFAARIGAAFGGERP